MMMGIERVTLAQFCEGLNDFPYLCQSSYRICHSLSSTKYIDSYVLRVSSMKGEGQRTG